MQPMAKSDAILTVIGPKYPLVKVHMMSAYGGFHPTVVAVQAAMREAGLPLQELSTFYQEAAAGDEDNLLRTCQRWVDVHVR
jgi:hypothetical protein